MPEQSLSDVGTSPRPASHSLEDYLPDFILSLSSQGFAESSMRGKIQIARKFSRWVAERRIEIRELDESALDAFFKVHPRPGHVRRGDLFTLRSLLEWLRKLRGVQAFSPKTIASDRQIIELGFSRYLEKERGLSKSTLRNYVHVIRCFLAERFGSAPAVTGEINASDVNRFVLRYSRGKGRRTAQLMTTALRAFFRFLYIRGEIGSDLALSVPTVADWRKTGLPESLKPEEVEILLDSCDRSTAVGKRDYAILVLLARIGLRAGEAVAMALDDIDWETGVIAVHGKGARHDLLPIPQDVGEALAMYLRHGRAPCESRRVFLRARAPRVGFSSSVAVADIVRRALARAGLDPVRKGAHLLRRSLATNMLRAGASLAEIGEILRHSTQNTTEIYAKVDLTTLGALALPWPGGDI